MLLFMRSPPSKTVKYPCSYKWLVGRWMIGLTGELWPSDRTDRDATWIAIGIRPCHIVLDWLKFPKIGHAPFFEFYSHG